MDYVKFVGGLVLTFAGGCVLVFRDDTMKVLAWLFGFLLVCGVMPFAAYAVNGTCGSSVNWSLDTAAGVLSITGSVQMTNYTSSTNAPWEEYKDRITSITVAGGVTKIGNYAFYDLNNVTSVTLNEGLQTIGGYAFAYCEALTELVIPATLNNIVNSAFGWSGIQKLTFTGSSVASFGSSVFTGSSGLKGAKILVPEGFKVGSTPVSAGKTGEAPFYNNYVGFTNGTATVVWENYDGTVLQTDTNLAPGTVPAYDGVDPVKESDETRTYIFNGFTPASVAAAANEVYVYRASYTTHEHIFGAPRWKWEEDFSKATASFFCSCGVEQKITDEKTDLLEVSAAGCETDRVIQYEAIVEFLGFPYADQSDDITIPGTATGHTYGEPTWSWAEDHGSATATFTCHCGDEQTVTDDETELIEVSAAGCENDQVVKYKAVVEFNDVSYTALTDEITVPDTATGHSYGEPSWGWAEDHVSATATFTCHCGDEQAVTDAETELIEVSAAGCENDQVIQYKAVVAFNDVSYTGLTDEIAVPDTRTGHKFTNYVYQNNATCTKNGTEIAACDNNCGTTDERPVANTASGHTYGGPVWSWTDDFTATVTFTCEKNDDTQTPQVAVTSEVTLEPTAETEGTRTYTASVEFNGRTYTDTKTEILPATGTPDDPDPTDTPDDPDASQNDGLCKWCGEPHTGFWGKFVGFFHSILYFFAHLFGKR